MPTNYAHVAVLDTDTGIRLAARRIAAAITRAVRDINAGQEALWESIQRLDTYTTSPPDDRYLHWEPSASGWRLYGDHLPPDTP